MKHEIMLLDRDMNQFQREMKVQLGMQDELIKTLRMVNMALLTFEWVSDIRFFNKSCG